MATIKHVFVLMMENRSFDHVFAFAGRSGVSPVDPLWGMTAEAPDRAPLDPPHEFENVQDQIGGSPPMSGFRRQPYWSVSGQGFGAGALPVITALANQYFLFDNWYSSMPGPTWPNRFFVHAGSAGGLDNTPSPATTIESESVDSLGFSFQNGTLFERLEAAGHSWRVYHDDLFPQVLAIKSMIDPFRVNDGHFSWLRVPGSECFVNDLANGYDVDYTFIEPNYGLAGGGLENGNSQHPTGSMAAGEAFIQYVYESIRNSVVWPESLLIVTYDEHGGFFDRAYPPTAIPPGDAAQNHDRAENPQNFGFDRLGVRVPAIAISPWIPQGGLGSQLFGTQVFDHTSIIHTVMELNGLAGSLTARDGAAKSILGVCSALELRSDSEDAPARLAQPPSASPVPAPSAAISASDAAAPAANTLKTFSRIAMSLDLSVAAAHGLAPVALGHPSFTGGAPDPDVRRAAARARTRQQTVAYIQSVAERVRQVRAN
jgi:phospholipase C